MERYASFEAHASHVVAVRFTHDGRFLISSGMDNRIMLWSVPDWSLRHAVDAHASSVNCLSLSPDGRMLATGSSDTTVKLWSFPELQVQNTLQDRKKVVAAVQFSADGRWVVAGSYGGRAAVWTVAGEPVVGIKASNMNLSSVAVSPDCSTLATAGLGDDIHLWDLPSGELRAKLTGHQTAVGALRFLAGGATVASLGYEQTIRFWDVEALRESRLVRPSLPGVRGMVFSGDERLLALGLPGLVQLWTVDDWKLQAESALKPKGVNGMAFSLDGRWLAVGAADGRIRVWALREGF